VVRNYVALFIMKLGYLQVGLKLDSVGIVRAFLISLNWKGKCRLILLKFLKYFVCELFNLFMFLWTQLTASLGLCTEVKQYCLLATVKSPHSHIF